MNQEKIKIEYVKTELLKFFPGNPRIFGEKGKNDLKRSIKKLGWTAPLLINMAPGREFIVLSGNMRLQVARELKIGEVPVVKVRVHDPRTEREMVLRMNVLNGSWDYELLKEWDIEIVIESGLSDFDLSPIFDSSLETEHDGFNTSKELGEIKKPSTRLGNIYRLGKHFLGCGDSTDRAFVKKVLGQAKVDMIYCDPKYNISLSYDKGVGGTSSYGGKIDDNMSYSEYKKFLKNTLENALSVAQTDCHIFYYSDQLYVGLIQEIYREVGIDLKRVCLWIKNAMNPTPQTAFNKCFEPCTYGVKGKPYISPKLSNLSGIMNKEIATGNRQLDDILDMIDLWLVKRISGQDYSHPTEKPVTLHEKALRRCTKVNDVVLDLFAGSGSTLIACEQLKRRCYTIDIEPIFCDLVIKRFESLTGQKAELISEGKNE